MPNSFAQITDFVCQECGKFFQAEVWLIIDNVEHPNLFNKIEQDTLHNFPCPNCQHELHVDVPLLLYALNERYPIIFSPANNTTLEQDEQQAKSLVGLLQENLKENWKDEWLENISTFPREVLCIFLRKGPEAATARLTQIQNSMKQPPDVKIPSGFEQDVRRMIDLAEQVQHDPYLLPQLVSALESTLLRLPPKQNPGFRAMLQDNLGLAYSNLTTGNRADNLHKAIECYHQAQIVYDPESDPLDYARTQNNLGNAYENISTGDREHNLRKAIECYKQALRIRTPKAAPLDYAATQNNLGIAYDSLPTGDRGENLRNAIECYQQALRFSTIEAAPLQFAATQNNLGNAYFNLPTGDQAQNLKKAIECYRQVLIVYSPESAPLDYAATMNNLGTAYSNLPAGDRTENLQNGIDCYNKALLFSTPEADPLEYAKVQHNLGNVYSDLPTGDRTQNLLKAIEFYQRALRFRTVEVTPLDFAMTQINLGTAYSDLPTGDRRENLRRAIECNQQALIVYTREAAPLDYAGTMNNLGSAFSALPTENGEDNLYKAIEFFQQALTVFNPEGTPLFYAGTQNNLGLAYSNLSAGDRPQNLRKAIECFQQALRFRTLEAAPLECRMSAQSLANLFMEQKRWREAFEVYHLALLASERLYQYAFLPESQQVEVNINDALYGNMVKTCLRLADDPGCRQEGLVIAEAGKARIFLDQMGQANYPPPAGVPQNLINEETQLLSHLRAMEISSTEVNLSPEKSAQFAGQRKEVQESLEIFWQRLVSEFPQAQNYVSLRRGQTLSWNNLAELSSRLGEETALVEFFVLDEEIAAFVLRSGRDAPLVFSLPISRQRLFHRYLKPYIDEILNRIPNRRCENTWLTLGEELFAPLLESLKGARFIYFIPHDMLHLLPLHALTVGGEPLILQKTVAYAPSAAILSRTLDRRTTSNRICSPLIVGYTPSKETEERKIFLGEAQEIAFHFRTSPHLDEETSFEKLKIPIEKADLLHFSCHGYFNSNDPIASSVLLAGGEITARAWMSLNLQAQLVTLSACQTGFSDINPGDDITGLSRALLYAGARSSLLTLWSVNAHTTREWMCNFYKRAWSHDGQPLISKAQAFQQAVLAMREQYGDPYFWAPFILIGDAS